MAESKDTPSRRVSSRIAGKPDNGLPSATAAAAKRKPTDAPAPAKKAKVVGAAAPTGNAAPSPASKVLTKGSPLPTVTLRDESGKDIDIAQLKKDSHLYLPQAQANTPGCTTQACLFRDEYAQFQKAGFQVYGLSSDGETSLKNWKEKKGFGYSLLSDPKRKLIAPLTGSASSTIRSHFVIDADGKLAHSAIKVKPAESSAAALEIAKGL